ncbi:MAG: hypothetical protein KC506_03555 [Nanoarchaeota archaeon]|nr:hypothetical protein [Nanoarchaeota archaeon]
MKKRGSSHTEIILAFVIFIAAVGFALFVFSPSSGGKKVETYLTYTFTEVTRKTETGLEVYSVILHPEKIVEDTIGVSFPEIVKNARVETYEGVELTSSRNGDIVYFQRGSSDWSEIDFVNVKFSDDFDLQDSFTGTHNDSYYDISTSYEKEIISEKKFKKLLDSYNSDYDSLKEDFNLKIDLAFSLVFDDGSEIKAEKDIPLGLEVYSDSKRVEVLRENGDIVFGDLKVLVW